MRLFYARNDSSAPRTIPLKYLSIFSSPKLTFIRDNNITACFNEILTRLHWNVDEECILLDEPPLNETKCFPYRLRNK